MVAVVAVEEPADVVPVAVVDDNFGETAAEDWDADTIESANLPQKHCQQ